MATSNRTPHTNRMPLTGYNGLRPLPSGVMRAVGLQKKPWSDPAKLAAKPGASNEFDLIETDCLGFTTTTTKTY